ncbi:T9SS type A sorting domain-containing protein, partial [bacterium]|nr:T9SS type A sorting domain-containing protein [bacterium]
IREAAQISGTYVDLEATWEEGRAILNGMSLHLYNWPEGTIFNPATAFMRVFTMNTAYLFVAGKLEVMGTMNAQGAALVLGCSDDMRILDDVIYEGTNMTSGALPPGCTSSLALVSEKNILIGNTWENGREGCTGNTPDHCNVVITALLFALGGSFELEQQNDTYEWYISPVNPDERGSLVLTGGITQRWRGYTHRSNLGGTGYARTLHYDSRLRDWDFGLYRYGDFTQPDTLVFDSAIAGQTIQDTLRLHADSGVLSVLSATWPFFTPPLYRALPPYEIIVSFTPPAVGNYTGTMTFYFNGETFLYPLRGNAISPPAPMLTEPLLYPNPFNSEAKLKFELAEAGEVRAIVYDVLGRETARIADGVFQAGEHSLSVNANAWASGVYFLRLETAEQVKVMKMLLVR